MINVPHLKDIAGIMTTDAFSLKLSENAMLHDVRYIYLPKKYEYGKTFFACKKGNIEEKGFIVLAREDVDIYYISFILNSIITALGLCDGVLNKEAQITKKKLYSLPVCIVDEDTSYYLGLSDMILQVIHKRIISYPDNEMYQYHYELFAEIRDGLAMELFIKPIFEKTNIHIISEWKTEVDSIDKPFINILASKIDQDNNELMNQVRKMRVLITNIGKILQENKDK